MITLANHERFEAYDRELMRGATFRKITLDRVSRRLPMRAVDIAERAFSRLARSALRLGLQSPSSLGSYHPLRRLVLKTPADLTILHTEIPFSMGRSLVARRRLIAADFEDWHSRDLLPESRASRPIRLLDSNEAFLMRRAAYVSAPSGAMGAALKDAYGGDSPVVIPNVFPLQPEPAALPRQSPPAFFWFSQTIGPGRGLEEFLRAWILSRARSSVNLLGDVNPSYREHLTGLVPVGRRASLRFLPLTSPETLPAVIAEARYRPRTRTLDARKPIPHSHQQDFPVPERGPCDPGHSDRGTAGGSLGGTGGWPARGRRRCRRTRGGDRRYRGRSRPIGRHGSCVAAGGGPALLVGTDRTPPHKHGDFGPQGMKTFAKRALSRLGWSLNRLPRGIVVGGELGRDLPLVLGSSPGSVCIDVGAHDGHFVDLLRECLAKPVIHAFEPAPRAVFTADRPAWLVRRHDSGQCRPGARVG